MFNFVNNLCLKTIIFEIRSKENNSKKVTQNSGKKYKSLPNERRKNVSGTALYFYILFSVEEIYEF